MTEQPEDEGGQPRLIHHCRAPGHTGPLELRHLVIIMMMTCHDGPAGAAGGQWTIDSSAPRDLMKEDRDLKISEEMPWLSAQRMEA